MKFLPFLAVLALLAISHPVLADEDDKPVAFDKLPAAVAKSMTAAAGDAKLEEITTNDDNGTPAYEAVWHSEGHRHQLTVAAATGRVIALEEQLKISEAPAAVSAAITKEAGDGKISKVEKVTEAGVTCYEAAIRTSRGKAEIRYDKDGREISRD